MQLQPYLNFDGTCAEAFRFYEATLGGKIQMMATFGEMPEGSGNNPAWKDLIMHVSMTVGDAVLMGSDAPPEMFRPMQGMSVSIGVTDVGEAERIYAALADGAREIPMPIQQTFWAERFAMLTDRFGTPWMINCGQPQQ